MVLIGGVEKLLRFCIPNWAVISPGSPFFPTHREKKKNFCGKFYIYIYRYKEKANKPSNPPQRRLLAFMSFFSDQGCSAQQNPLNKIINVPREPVGSSFGGIGHPQQQGLRLDLSREQELVDFRMMNNFGGVDVTPGLIDRNSILPSVPVEKLQQSTLTGNWVNEFHQLNINEGIQVQHQHQHQQQQNGYAHSQAAQLSGNANANVMGMADIRNAALSRGQMNIGQGLLNMTQSSIGNTFKSVTSISSLSKEFDSAFSEIENEIEEEMPAVDDEPPAVIHSDEDKVKFAQLANSVFTMMNNTPKGVSTETAGKFKQSNFMNLMNRISNREVELSIGNDALVDSQGRDIHDKALENLGLASFETARQRAQQWGVEAKASNWQADFS